VWTFLWTLRLSLVQESCQPEARSFLAQVEIMREFFPLVVVRPIVGIADTGAVAFANGSLIEIDNTASVPALPVHDPYTVFVPIAGAAPDLIRRSIRMQVEVTPPSAAMEELVLASGSRRTADQLPVPVCSPVESIPNAANRTHRGELAVLQAAKERCQLLELIDADQQVRMPKRQAWSPQEGEFEREVRPHRREAEWRVKIYGDRARHYRRPRRRAIRVPSHDWGPPDFED